MDGRTTEHGYTISSPCEPDGSGELKSGSSSIRRQRGGRGPGVRTPPPPWNLKILPKKVISQGGGVGSTPPPPPCYKVENYHFLMKISGSAHGRGAWFASAQLIGHGFGPIPASMGK